MAEGSNAAAHSVRRQAVRRKAQRRHAHFYQRCAHWSFSQHSGQPIRWYRERWLLAGTGALLAMLSLLVIPAWATAMHREDIVSAAHTRVALALPPLPAGSAQRAPVVKDWRNVKVQSGQTLSEIFSDQGLGFDELQRVLAAGGDNDALKQIHPGDEFSFLMAPDGSLQAIRFDRDESTRVVLHVNGEQIHENTQPRAVEQRMHFAHGVINSSLFSAGAAAGMNTSAIYALANVFKYDIDFAQDLRPGDRFTVIYNDVYRDGEYLHAGNVVAAEFVNQGKHYTAMRFTKPDGDVGYYSLDGRPLQKAFLRTPVDFTRISSRFTAARMHPILGRMRAHKGVDYAAPTGTPIYAAGDGVIKFRGREHGYGNFIVIQHNKRISTAYGHMSRFARAEHVGTHVHQGEIIGYVGMTGLATGPHLHYEFRVNGVQRNPLTVTMPKPEPLPPALMAKFRSQTDPLMARLKTMQDTRLARAD